MKTLLTIIPLWVITCCSAFAEDDVDRKDIKAISSFRTSVAPKLDGLLTDECWRNAPVASSFITNSPVFGNNASQTTEVRVLYDNDAIYIGAYMHDPEPQKIIRRLCSRDQVENSNVDFFAFGFDTYHDRQSAFKFVVSAAGVQDDIRMSANSYDNNWDAVWTSKVSIQNDGWIAEIKIPYAALRFPKKEVQTWGMNLVRNIQRYNEISTWSPVNPNVSGSVNQWGDMNELQNIKPPLRLSLMPYIGSSVRNSPNNETKPTDYTTSFAYNGGLDIKYGINESFTLDMTLIPDFGQVQSDNLVLNLGPFEQRLDERRPFFTEGTDLFSKADLFYSRRIGGRPLNYYDVEDNLSDGETITSNPTETQLLNATKFSGRTDKNLGIGVLNAIGAPVYAKIKNQTTNETRNYQTSPLTNYNILVFDQALKNNSAVSFINTNVMRAGGERDANVSALDMRFTGKKNNYSLTATGKLSQIYQDNNPKIGYAYSVGYSKISGNFRFDLTHKIIDNKFDPNDLGILFQDNSIENFVGVKYLDFKPKGILLNWDTYLGFSQSQRYIPFSFQKVDINVGANALLKNYWNVSVYGSFSPFKTNDFFEPRTEGRVFVRPAYYYAGFWAKTDTRKKVYVMFTGGLADSRNPKDMYYEGTVEPNWRISDRFSIAVNVSASKDFSNFGYIETLDNSDIVIGRRTVNSVTNAAGVQYSFTPKMNINLRARHYWSKVVYYDYHTLNNNGSLTLNNEYGENNDINFNLFNLDLVYSWEFTPGSRLNIIWKDSIFENDNRKVDDYFDNVDKTFNSPQDNFFAVKLLYFLDYAKMKHWFS
ncbi:MAG: carbohydrate binding family 9 domain-containing protein [Sphingobacteriales bacterium]|nr:carbohydrate binding family 9 domain-containing protein [Sphingobacteriales bacterium]